MESRKVIGQRIKRVDGPQKSSGRAKYASDFNARGLLFAAYLHSPYAYAKLDSIDTSEAEKMPGVKSVHVAVKPGTELAWEGFEIAGVAATSEEQARDAVRKIKVQYTVLPHFVKDEFLEKAGTRAKQGGERLVGDPDAAFKAAEGVSEGTYGIPVVNHCCLEPHGQVIQWKPGNSPDGKNDEVMVWPSTQNVPTYATNLAPNLKVPVSNIKVRMDYIGGGFGSKFNPDAWAEMGAWLSKKAGGAPVKVFLERAPEQMIGGNRPSAYAKIKVGGKKDGTITAFDAFTWGTGGYGAVNPAAQPYVFTGIPNIREIRTPVSVNAGSQRAWRAPGNQQSSYLTCCAVEDFAHKIGKDPLDVFKANIQYAAGGRTDTYRYQLEKAAELAEWTKLWKPRGQNGSGTIKRGLGIGVSMWNGAGHAGQCRTVINPDGSVTVEIGTQDLGTGTRTVIGQVVAETLGLQFEQVKVVMGTNDLPPDNGSGGSTTVGAVSTSSRKSTVNALEKLFEAVAPSLGAEPSQLQAIDGQIRVKGSPNKSMSWRDAARKITTPISEMGANVPAQAAREGLNTGGASGVQIADVSVDTETGIVKMNRYVAVADCGLVINPRLAESQVYGAIIMGIGTALFEERIMDERTGKTLNADM
jgi:xanthine dehydrogenase YagR molybdenum-binding subunit